MTKLIDAEELDALVDAGEDITEYMDMPTICHPNWGEEVIRRVNVDYPNWVVESLDAEAKRIGVSRQALIKMWTVERLEDEAVKRKGLGLTMASSPA